MNITDLIVELLQQGKSISMPGIGTLASVMQESYLDPATNTLCPASRTVAFDPTPSADSSMVQELAARECVSADVAEQMWRNYLDALTDKIKRTGSHQMGSLGTLTLGSNKQYGFQLAEGVVLNDDNSSIKPLSDIKTYAHDNEPDPFAQFEDVEVKVLEPDPIPEPEPPAAPEPPAIPESPVNPETPESPESLVNPVNPESPENPENPAPPLPPTPPINEEERERVERILEGERRKADKKSEADRKRAEEELENAKKKAEEERQKSEKEAEAARIKAEKKAAALAAVAAREEAKATKKAEAEAEKARLRAEQEAEAARLKADREAEAARLKAEKEAEKSRIKAEKEEARRKAEQEKLNRKAEKQSRKEAERKAKENKKLADSLLPSQPAQPTTNNKPNDDEGRKKHRGLIILLVALLCLLLAGGVYYMLFMRSPKQGGATPTATKGEHLDVGNINSLTYNTDALTYTQRDVSLNRDMVCSYMSGYINDYLASRNYRGAKASMMDRVYHYAGQRMAELLGTRFAVQNFIPYDDYMSQLADGTMHERRAHLARLAVQSELMNYALLDEILDRMIDELGLQPDGANIKTTEEVKEVKKQEQKAIATQRIPKGDTPTYVYVEKNSKQGFDIIAGFYLNKSTAAKMTAHLHDLGCDAYIIEKDENYYVSMGSAKSRTAAEALYKHIKSWYDGDIVIKEW